jgi:hypothetical protein
VPLLTACTATAPQPLTTPSPFDPTSPRYELCTKLGLYVIDEANIESHGFDPLFVHDPAHPAHNSEWLGAMLERGARCGRRLGRGRAGGMGCCGAAP